MIAAIASSCASHKPKGMRKSRKKNCDCPSFGYNVSNNKIENTYTKFNG